MKAYKILFISIFLSLAGALFSQDLTGVKIHINPGHGGFDANDRGISTPLVEAKEKQGFWESQSNLDKGLQLRDMLEALNCTVQMSRTTNNPTIYDDKGNITHTDDTPLSQVVQMANEFGADFMLSIHSNAGAGTANYLLQLYAGKDADDTHNYPTPTPVSNESRAISTEIAKNLIKNQMTHWTSPNYSVIGDKSYGRKYMGWSDGYGVLRSLRVPGVISEGSMHDYIPETYRLLNMEYKWLEAWNFKKAFCTYFKQAEIPTGNIAGWVKDNRNLLLDGKYMKYSKDRLLPLDGATLTIEETGDTYLVDNMRNGVYVFKDLLPGEYTVKAEAEGYYPQTEKITVVKNEISYFNFELNKVRDTAPEVISHSPANGEEVECSTHIVFDFNWDMEEESTRAAFSISPSVEGTITFEDSQYRMRFRPSVPLEPSTTYTVTLDKSARHPDNKTMVEDCTFSFITNSRNRLKLLESFPVDGAETISEQPLFWFIFDQELTTRNVQDVFSITDAQGTKLDIIDFRSAKSNKAPEPYGSYSFPLISNLEIGKEYKLIIGGELTDVVGIKLTEPVEISFNVSGMQTADGEIIEDFETDKKYIAEKESSSNVSTITVTRSDKIKLFGTNADCLRARFTDLEGYAIYQLADFELGPLVPDRKVFGMHVYGDMSGNELQLQFSAGSDIRYMKICDLDFGGWEFVEAEFINPNPDGTEYKFTGFRIVRNEEKVMSEFSEVYLDNLLIYDNLVNNISEIGLEESILIYPNPVSDIIHIQTAFNETPVLELYSFSGSLLKQVKANQIAVSDFSAGTYILKVKTEKGIYGKAIIINR